MIGRSCIDVVWLSRCVFLTGCLGGLVFATQAPAADEPKETRAEAGKCLTKDGTIVQREEPGKAWQVVKQGAALHSRDLLLGLPSAALESKNGAVRLGFLSDLTGTSPFPVLETAVVLHQGAHVDLDFTLDRGRVDVANLKEKGAAHVRVRFQNQVWEITLEEPKARVSLEIYGRWPRGAMFTTKPGPHDVPDIDVLLLVLHGQVDLKHNQFHHGMSAAPGAALIEWNNRTGGDEAPHYLKEPPAWAAEDPNAPLVKQKKANLEHLRRLMVEKSIDAAVDELLNADDPNKRRGAVIVMGALDDLKRLGATLANTKHTDVWDNGVLVARHWIGRGPGQDQKLYNVLLASGKYNEVEAETVLQLLHSFGPNDLARPETYTTLVRYLGHDKIAIRGLAYWHLYRLVPDGRELGYKPMDPKEKRDLAIKEWKKLIASIKEFPPRPKLGDK